MNDDQTFIASATFEGELTDEGVAWIEARIAADLRRYFQAEADEVERRIIEGNDEPRTALGILNVPQSPKPDRRKWALR